MIRKYRSWALSVLCVAAAVTLWGQAPRPTAQRPNLLIITIDTLRPDHLECYGYRAVKTPRINSLATDGVLIENAYTPVPLTLPSHASIFTGTYPVFHGVRDFVGFTLSQERTTLAEMLKSVGYSTGAVVGSAVLEARWGLNQGFDFYYDNFAVSLDRDWQPIAERRGDEVVREGLKWLGQHKSGPFFLWIHLFDPHDPYRPPPPYDRQYATRPYDGEIAYTDELVGKLLDYLKANGLYESSAIVLLSDHGEGLGEHGEKYHGFFIYDSTLRIPMIFKVPGASRPRGVRLGGPMRTIDVVPTVLQMLGLAGKVAATESQGRGEYGAMLGKTSPGELTACAEIYLPFYHFQWSPLTSIRRGRYKFIEAPQPELYDTQTDPGEVRNLVGKEGAVAGKLREMLRQAESQYAAPAGSAAAPQAVDPATVEKLQSLGYLTLAGPATVPAPNRNLPDPKSRIEVYELIRAGTIAAQQKDFQRAVRDLSEAVRREPGSVIAHFQLGNVYRVLRELDRAELEFKRTIELKPDHSNAVRRLAEIYLAGRRYDEAENAYRQVLSQSPDDFQSYFNLGGLYVTLDRWDDALAAFQKAEDLNTRDARIPTIISRILLRKGDIDAALQAAERAIRLDSGQAAAHETALQIYRRKGMSEDAEREARILERLKTKR